MHRKTGSSIDYKNSSLASYNSYSYQPYNANIGFMSSQPQPHYKFKEDPSINYFGNEDLRNSKRHARNYSDVGSCQVRAVQTSEKKQKFQDNKLKQISQKLVAMDQKIRKMEAKFQHLPLKQEHSNINFNQKLLLTYQTETQIKLNQITINLKNLRQKVQQLHEPNKKQLIEIFALLQSENVSYNKADYKSIQFIQKFKQGIQALIQGINKDIKSQLNQLNEKVRLLAVQKSYIQSTNPQQQFFKTNRKYSGNAISFVYEQYIRKMKDQKYLYFRSRDEYALKNKEINRNSQVICLNEVVYYLDPEGFLLDQNNNYLVNSQMKQIKLSQKELKMLRKQNILKY